VFYENDEGPAFPAAGACPAEFFALVECQIEEGARMNSFVVIPIAFIIASVLWFGWCAASAGRGTAARIILGVMGGGVFILISGGLPMIFREQMRQLCMQFPDPNVIVGVFILSAVIVFLLGLLLRSIIRKPV